MTSLIPFYLQEHPQESYRIDQQSNGKYWNPETGLRKACIQTPAFLLTKYVFRQVTFLKLSFQV